MKRIDTTKETATSWSPFKVESKAFMQDANKEMFKVLARNLIVKAGYSPTTLPFLIESFNGFDQAIYFQGEIYKTNVVSTSPTVYAIIDTTPDAVADPTTFSDGVVQNIHNNRNIISTTTAAGSMFNFGQVVDITVRTVIPFINITPNTNWVVPATYYGSPNVFQYRKNANNEVELRGVAQNTDMGVTPSVFTLPVGFRPTNVKEFVSSFNTASGSGTFGAARVVVAPNGMINVFLTASNYYILDNVRFSLD